MREFERTQGEVVTLNTRPFAKAFVASLITMASVQVAQNWDAPIITQSVLSAGTISCLHILGNGWLKQIQHENEQLF